jgi:uridine kinase
MVESMNKKSPLIIGIAGGTGSGKSTVARNLVKGLPDEMVAIIDHDSYYRDRADLSFEERCALNFDHPESLDTSLLIEQLKSLREGNAIEVPIYDFKTHSRKPATNRIEPKPIVFVEGILVFVDPELRAQFDMKIFVDTDADIRVFRRIRRDIEERNRTFQSVRDQYYNTVRPMHLQFVEPSKRWADIIIPEGGNNHVALDMIIGKLKHVIATL